MGSIVQRATPADTVNGTAITATFSTAPTPGNLLVFVAHSTGSPDPFTTPAGVDLDLALLDGDRPTDFYSRVVQSGDPTTWTFDTASTTASLSLVGWELSGVNTVTVPAQSVGTTNDATLVTTKAVGPTPGVVGAGDVVVAAVGLSGTSGGTPAVSGGTTLVTTPSTRALFSDRVLSVGVSSQSATFSWTTARRAVAGLLTYSYQEGPVTPPAVRKVWYRLNDAGTTWVPGELIRL